MEIEHNNNNNQNTITTIHTQKHTLYINISNDLFILLLLVRIVMVKATIKLSQVRSLFTTIEKEIKKWPTKQSPTQTQLPLPKFVSLNQTKAN